ncbi:helix-turn-helix domain-containing protein [Ligilactobacillus acidipiscis]|nr:helix-turn-helix domain-containing protein [Ligilactobacillus acidipiscis]WEV56048.1 helix-turn-helix domain-containing protein [Ligilactobacillus acidipiscis]
MSGRTNKATLAERHQAVTSVLQGQTSVKAAAKRLQVSHSTIENWLRAYRTAGVTGLEESHTRKVYSTELKRQAVLAYLSGNWSLKVTCDKYKISSKSVLRRWVDQYNSGKTLVKKRGHSQMKAGRKTKFNERIEIAQYTIANELDYQKAMKKYDVSYSQVYSWVRKYRKQGQAGLADRRGKSLATKPQLSEKEAQTLRIKELEARNQYLEAENDLLKNWKRSKGGPGEIDLRKISGN